MKKEYTKPTLTSENFDITTDVAAEISTTTTNWGEVVDGGTIWSDVQ